MKNIFERYYNSRPQTSEYKISKEERNQVLEAIKNFNTYGQFIYRSDKLVETINEIAELVEAAKGIALQETDGWFDDITINRHGKGVDEALKVLKTEAAEMSKRQQRLEAAFEDVGKYLQTYFEA
jgi:hypothetical protein